MPALTLSFRDSTQLILSFTPQILVKAVTPVIPPLPSPWSYKGCFTDISTSRTLAASMTNSDNNMTIETCMNFCNPQGYIFAGVEFGRAYDSLLY